MRDKYIIHYDFSVFKFETDSLKKASNSKAPGTGKNELLPERTSPSPGGSGLLWLASVLDDSDFPGKI